MKNSYLLNIQDPCNEKWNTMQPHDRGKFCLQCSKEVIDFTKLDNTEIIQIIEQSKSRICGRMSVSQLDRLIEIPSKKNRSKLRKVLTAIFLIGSTGSIFASPLVSKANSLNVSKNESNYKRIDIKKHIRTDSLKNTLKGQVLTESEEPIPGADIFIKELNVEIETDSNGYFKIILPKDLKENYVTVNIKYLGFQNVETRIYKNDWLNKLNFYLKEREEFFIGEVMIYKIRWWQFWKRW